MRPLKICKLRTAGLASVNSAKFGLVRRNGDGSKRAHQGIDLQANKGDMVLAVADGTVVGVNMGLDGYGYTVTHQFEHEGKPLFAFYAHLSLVAVKVGEKVSAGSWIGKTGSTGNAKGMDTIEKGGHLHLEFRTKQNCGLGLKDRLNPLDFIELDE
jgi:murein DD-endopeptidase MepM/ murein hydrolase activator NlpD